MVLRPWLRAVVLAASCSAGVTAAAGAGATPRCWRRRRSNVRCRSGLGLRLRCPHDDLGKIHLRDRGDDKTDHHQQRETGQQPRPKYTRWMMTCAASTNRHDASPLHDMQGMAKRPVHGRSCCRGTSKTGKSRAFSPASIADAGARQCQQQRPRVRRAGERAIGMARGVAQ